MKSRRGDRISPTDRYRVGWGKKRRRGAEEKEEEEERRKMDSTEDWKIEGLEGRGGSEGKAVRTETSRGLDKREVSRIVFFWPRNSSIPSVKLRGKRVRILLSTNEFRTLKGNT